MKVCHEPAPPLNTKALRQALAIAASARQQMVAHLADPSLPAPETAEFNESPDIMAAAMMALTYLPQLLDRIDRLHALLPSREAQMAREMGL